MRKHFLILMLLTLLPLAGWATITVTEAPELNTGVAYSGLGQTVIKSGKTGTANSQGTLTWSYAVTTDGNAPAADATNTWKSATALKVTNAGTYYVWYKVDSNLDGEASIAPTAIDGNFTITKKALTVKFDGNSENIPDIKINYGEANPAPTYVVSFDGFVNNETAAKVSGSLSYTQSQTNANYKPNGTTAITGKEKYAVTFSGFTADNYSFTYPTVKMIIKQVALAATPAEIPAEGGYFTYAKNAGSLTYDATDQVASYTIVYHDAQGQSHSLNVSTGTTGEDVKDYKFTAFKYKATAEEAYADQTTPTAHTNAGYYQPTITAEATGNYDGSLLLSATGLDFQIAKRDVWVYVNDDTKVYDGTAYSTAYNPSTTTTDASKITYTQLKGLTPATITGVSIAYIDEADLQAANAKTNVNTTGYRMIPVVANNSNLRTNHNVNIMNTGRWKITKRPIKATAVPKTITFGDPTPSFAANATYITLEANSEGRGLLDDNNADEKALIYNALTIGLNGTYTAVNEDGYEDAIVVALKSGSTAAEIAALAAVSNYDIQPVAGDYTILGAAYTIVAKPKTITYGDEYALTDFEYFTNGADPAATVEFELWKNNKKLTSLPKDAGEYEIRIVEKDAYLPTGYTLPITYVRETFTIEKKKITAVLAPQTLMVGDTKAALQKSMVQFVEDPAATTPVSGIVGEDVIGFALDFNVGATAGQITEDVYSATEADAYNKTLTGAIDYEAYTVGQTFTAAQVTEYNTKVQPTTAVTTTDQIADTHITAIKNYNAGRAGAVQAGTVAAINGYSAITKKLTKATTTAWAAGIKIALDNTVANNKNANYTINVAATAALSVITNAALALASNDNDLTNIEKIAALANPTVPVTLDLNARTVATPAAKWDAQKWNTMVLPFDIEVADLSAKLGYAIVNVLDKENTTGTKVAFKLYMDKIPANTPFVVKTAKKLIKETGDADGTYVDADGVIDFGNQLVKAPTAAQKAGADAGNGCLFVPVYKTKAIDVTMPLLRFLMGDRDKWNYVSKATTVWNVVPFAAYIDVEGAGENAREMIFTFQEADGSTTAIKAIDMDAADSVKGFKAEGWYTLNGVKLQGMPTEKGIYINNGKKVVIK